LVGNLTMACMPWFEMIAFFVTGLPAIAADDDLQRLP
jgi:hypothetical protein